MFDASIGTRLLSYKSGVIRFHGPEILVVTDDDEIESAFNAGVEAAVFGERLRARYVIARRVIGQPTRGQLSIYYIASVLAGINTALATANFQPYEMILMRVAIGAVLGFLFPLVIHEIYWWGWRRG